MQEFLVVKLFIQIKAYSGMQKKGKLTSQNILVNSQKILKY